MLSPGEYHKLCPKPFKKNLKWRESVVELCYDRSYRKAIMDFCRQDIIFWVNTFVWQYNPDKFGQEVEPFTTWDYQDQAFRDILECVETRTDGYVEKSREMGASWMFQITQDWICRFHKNKSCLNISRNEDAVDDGTSNCLFWKLWFINEWLPDWLKMGVTFSTMHVKYPRTQSEIVGEASTKRSGSGARGTLMFIDEFTKIQQDFEVLSHTAATSSCRLFNFTHVGLDSAAWHQIQQIKSGCLKAKHIVMHWPSHPLKRPGLYRFRDNKIEIIDKSYEFPPDYEFDCSGKPTGGPAPGLRSVWYDKQPGRHGSDRAMAMNVDIDPEGSVNQYFDALMIHNLIATYATEPYWRGNVILEPEQDGIAPRVNKFVPDPEGPLKLWINLDTDGKPPEAPYAAGADISAGTGNTRSCFTIANGQTGEKVLEYANASIHTHLLAPLCVALCWLFKDKEGQGAAFAWESNGGPGVVFGHRVLELGYRRIHWRRPSYKYFEKGSQEEAGWFNTPDACSSLLGNYKEALRLRSFLNRSEPALKECLAFKYASNGSIVHSQQDSPNDPSGARVNHADLVIADALTWMMMKGQQSRLKEEEKAVMPISSLAWRRLYHETQRKEEQAWF